MDNNTLKSMLAEYISQSKDKQRYIGSLDDIRQAIDTIDDQILSLLQKRASLSLNVAIVKNGSTIYRPERECAILDRLNKQNDELFLKWDTTINTEKDLPQKGGLQKEVPLSPRSIQHIWTEIFSSSRAIQNSLKVAFLGPKGTFSHHAAMNFFGHSTDFIPCGDFADIFSAVQRGDATMGIVPIENSQQGSVGQCLDLFASHPVSIIAEYYADICHCVLSTEKEYSSIQKIYSHPQALMQCSNWIKRFIPHAECIEMSSTAKAAERALAEENSAVLGHKELVDILRGEKTIHILARDIANIRANQTRFVVISLSKPQSSEFKNPKTSLMFSLSHQPGTLAKILNIFEEEQINLTKLESRPLYNKDTSQSWKYRFFADARGNLSINSELWKKLENHCHDIQALGVYEDSKVL